MGASVGQKPAATIWIFYHYIDGIPQDTNSNLKLQLLQQWLQSIEADVFAFTEASTCWDMVKYKKHLLQRSRGWWEVAHWSLSFNRLEKYPTKHQPGGTGILITNRLAHHAL